MPRPRVTHLFPTFRNMGGAEAVLRGHWRHDADYGIDSSFICYYEKPEPPIERVAFLAYDGATTIKTARAAFAKAIAEQKPDICFYHGLWALKYFMDIDAAQRRILMVHGNPANYPDMLAECRQWADAFGTVSKPQYDRTLKTLPDFAPGRVTLLHCPFFAPAEEPQHIPLADRPFVIGYCGRLTVTEKRIDRAPDLVKALEASGIDYRMEFLGNGDMESQLQETFRANPRVIFHGRKTGDEYWQALRKWDAFILFSDTEGTPISILETMHEGILPIMPGINSGADYYAKLLGDRFVYPPYDFNHVIETIRWLQSLPASDLLSLRKKGRGLVSAHLPQNYFKDYARFLEQVRALPRQSTNKVPKRPWPIDSIPFKTLDRLSKIRQSIRA